MLMFGASSLLVFLVLFGGVSPQLAQKKSPRRDLQKLES
jgi:hypothetical protein